MINDFLQKRFSFISVLTGVEYQIAVAYWIISMEIVLPSWMEVRCWMTLNWLKCPGTRFTNEVSIKMYVLFLFMIFIKGSLCKFSHNTAAMLSWHVLKFAVIWWPVKKLFTTMKFKVKLLSEMCSWGNRPHEAPAIASVSVHLSGHHNISTCDSTMLLGHVSIWISLTVVTIYHPYQN